MLLDGAYCDALLLAHWHVLYFIITFDILKQISKNFTFVESM